MTKNAQAVIEQLIEEMQEKQRALTDKEKLYLKLEKEADIRMKLDAFAREMAMARADRDKS